jgi:hypothetical protein
MLHLEMISCPNCGHEADHIFCSNCGHPLKVKRITLSIIFHEAAHAFWHLEKGILFTLKELGRNPGLMQKRYMAGKRKSYQKPFSLFAISGTICALSLFLIYKNAPDESDQYFYKHFYFLVQACMLPFYALITYLLFIGPNLYYAEALVMNVYMLAFMSLGIIPINCLSYFLPNGIISLLEVIFLLSYSIWTYIAFFSERHTPSTIIKTILSIILSYMVFNFASRLIMYWFM